MRPFQFTVRALLGLAAVVALGCTAMINASPIWSSGITAAVLIVLTVMLLRALILGRQAVFCIGFATVGWLYFSFAVGPWASTSSLRGRLPTDIALTNLAAQRYLGSVEWTWGDMPFLQAFDHYLFSPYPGKAINAYAFCEIGHGLITLVLGFCGGLLAIYIAGARSRRDKQARDGAAEGGPPRGRGG